jgi:hypothetical protein
MAFRERGWRDRGSAVAIVRALMAEDAAVSTGKLAGQVEPEFLRENQVRRADVESLLKELGAARPTHR